MNIHLILARLRAVLIYGRQNGLKAVINLLRRKLFHSTITVFSKIDALGFYDFIRYQPIGKPPAKDKLNKTTINWIIPPASRGSGGHLNIFRFIYHLEKLGFRCSVTIFGEPQPISAEQAKIDVQQWFFPLQADFYIGIEQSPTTYIAVATSWQTAYAVRNLQSTCHRCYFVQDFEPWFYAAGSEYAFAEQTYRFGFTGITAGDWLADKLARDYGMQTYAVGFSYDADRYRPLSEVKSHKHNVFFYARPPTLRRGFELGLLVLHEVTKRLDDVNIIFAGWDISNYAIPFQYENAVILDLDDLPNLYARCDAALVISFSNLSLLPLELMACGVPVISNEGPFTEWLLNDNNAKLSKATIDDLADAICAVLENESERQRIIKGGFATVQKTSWLNEAERMGAVFSHLNESS